MRGFHRMRGGSGGGRWHCVDVAQLHREWSLSHLPARGAHSSPPRSPPQRRLLSAVPSAGEVWRVVRGYHSHAAMVHSLGSPSSPSSLHSSGPHPSHLNPAYHAPIHATTILAVRKGGDVVVIGDGQVTLGATVVKPNARKVRVIGGGKVIAGFAGSTADCFALLEHLEKKLDEFPSQLLRAGVELAKAWRMDRMLRHLEATVVAVDKDISITLTGNGDVISEPDNGVIGIGSGGLYAVSAAHALVDLDHLTARQVAIRAMDIASDVCIYTNKHFVVEAFERGVLLQGKDKAQREVEDWQHRDAQSAARKKLNDAAEKQHIQQLRQQPPLHTATAPAEHTASHHTPAPPAPHNDTAPPSSTDPKGGAGSPSAAQLPSPQSR